MPLTRARLGTAAIALLLACGGDPADGGARAGAAAVGPVPPGLPCSTLAPCESGLACEVVPPVPVPICTAPCERFADCEQAGFDDGCCRPRRDGTAACVAGVYGPEACPAREPIGPGEQCSTGRGCGGGLECWYVPPLNLLACTRACADESDCGGAGFADACCARLPGNTNPVPLCMPRAWGVCPP